MTATRQQPLRRRLIPRFLTGLRARLVIAFVAVVAIALILVAATLPRLLDDYFEQQSTNDLQRRAGQMRNWVAPLFLRYQFAQGPAAQPLLTPTEPLDVAEGLKVALMSPEEGVPELAREIAQSNVRITVAVDRTNPDEIVYELFETLPDDFAAEGQEREPITAFSEFTIVDDWWTQSGAAAPVRLVKIHLSEPFTFRAQTLERIGDVMSLAAVFALVAAIVISIFIADRLAHPVRRLTRAARELSEGHLDVRVRPPSASPEVSDLAEAFNAMAERLQRSIEYIRRDRDRSRDFLADVSHELRTPIAALRTFNELLAEEPSMDEPTRLEFLEQSRQQIDRLDWLATNLLELSKLESGLVLLDLRPDDLRAVVENSVQQQMPNAERRSVTLAMDLPSQPIRQRHDPQRLGQVVSNLIANAIKFTEPGGRVDVTLSATKEGAEIRVVDTGVGIDPKELPRVFDRFYRGAAAQQSHASGSGLGLSIVRSIVEMHSGRVAITSARGKGTQVSIALPRDVAVSSPAAVHA